MNRNNGIKTAIKTVTKLDTNISDNVTWADITKSEKQAPPIPRGRGELPYQIEIQQFPSVHQNLNQNSKTKKKMNQNQQKNKKSSNKSNFSQIIPSVREVNGGWNTLSNEAIERRHKERQLKYAKENNLDSSSSSKDTFSTASSGTSDSYKTAFQNSYELMINEKLTRNLGRYKRNVLMAGLLHTTKSDNIDHYDVAESSTDTLNISVESISNGIANLNTEEDEQSMRDDRVVMFFQSQEDEDVYCHPLKEQIKKDPEWQNQRLKRKGVETVVSARQYYMNLDDDCFTFQSKSKDKSY